jgi:hypothetical protein
MAAELLSDSPAPLLDFASLARRSAAAIKSDFWQALSGHANGTEQCLHSGAKRFAAVRGPNPF